MDIHGNDSGGILYRRTQIGWVLIVGLGLAQVTMLAAYMTMRTEALLGGLVMFVLLELAFSSMTVTVTRMDVTVAFAWGFIRKQVPLADVTDVRAVRNTWLMGWGIRYLGTGWMWNVSGLDAVELSLLGGRRFRIGTDQPGKLLDAVRAAIGQG